MNWRVLLVFTRFSLPGLVVARTEAQTVTQPLDNAAAASTAPSETSLPLSQSHGSQNLPVTSYFLPLFLLFFLSFPQAGAPESVLCLLLGQAARSNPPERTHSTLEKAR